MMQAGNGGSIVNVASASGIKAVAKGSAYCASKAAVRMSSKTVALECIAAGRNIRVNVVSPEAVKTPMSEQQDFWPGLVAQHGNPEAAWEALGGSSWLTPEDIAKAILFLASEESSYMNVEADGGRYLGYVRLIGRRRNRVKLEEYCWLDTMRSFPPQYTKKPLLRSQET
jgi:NAD(P)-dependent dehydrogenase (short-subunit alcohol dehydrogenase family)